MKNINSALLLAVIGGLAVKHKKCPARYNRSQSQQRLKKLYFLYLKLKEHEEKLTRLWVRDILLEDQRLLQGASNNLVDDMQKNDREKYFNFFRMYPETFNELLSIIGPKIEKQNVIRQSISSKVRLELTLRYLASGDSMTSLHYMFRVGKNTVSEIIAETCQVIWESLKDIVFIKPTEENWRKIAETFNDKWNFKNCIGALDGKHVVMQAPPNSGSRNYNYKGSHSIVLLAVADANYQFIMVDIGAEGKRSDSGIFKSSCLGQGFEQKLFNLPQPVNGLPYVLVADEAFPLTEYMMRPYPRRGDLNLHKKVFNYRLSRARRIIESSFGLLVSTWRIFRKPIIASEATVKKIVQATVCLHNYLLIKKHRGSNRQVPDSNEVNISTDSVEGLLNLRRSGCNMYARSAMAVREKFTDFFCTDGAVDWQWQKVIQNDF